MSPLPPAYAHVLSLGILWTSVHCASMCGPLLCGLHIGGARPDVGASAARGLGSVLIYQVGRGLTYAWLGGLAGLIGAELKQVFTAAGSVLSLLFGAALIYSTILRRTTLIKLRRRPDKTLVNVAIGQIRALLSPLLLSTHPLRELALGALLGFLPCMIVAWALGQAAITGSPFHGAAIMLLLVALTTPGLLLTTQLPRLGRVLPPRWRSGMAAILPAVSGLWLLLIGGAGLALWPHKHLCFTLFDRPLMMMIF